MMNRGENNSEYTPICGIREKSSSDSIPTDLFLEIFSRLPGKSIGRFRCVSKQWRSMLHSPDFTDLFFTKSSARPRLLFAVQQDDGCSFFSSPQPSSSSHVSVDFHTKFVVSNYIFSYGCGLIYFESEEAERVNRVICNPITGQYTILPELKSNIYLYSYLGFDPIDKQFKLLVMNTYGYIAHSDSVHHILTLGSGNIKWRTVQCSFPHEPFDERICINGVLYYLAQSSDGSSYVIVCFDVRSEEFKFINTQGFSYGHPELVNYKGKLGAINFKKSYDSGIMILKLYMWVLEDVEKHEWLKYVYAFLDNEVLGLSVAGMTATGDIVLSKGFGFTCKPFYVFYFNPEKNTLQRVEIHGNHQVLGNRNRVYAYVDHVEDLKFDIMCAATSISPPEQKRIPKSTSTRNDHQLLFHRTK